MGAVRHRLGEVLTGVGTAIAAVGMWLSGQWPLWKPERAESKKKETPKDSAFHWN